MEKQVSIICPHCRKTLHGRKELEGKRIKCPGCAQPILIQRREVQESSQSNIGKHKTATSNQAYAHSKNYSPSSQLSVRHSGQKQPPRVGPLARFGSLGLLIAACLAALVLWLLQNQQADTLAPSEEGSTRRASLFSYFPEDLEQCAYQGTASLNESGMLVIFDPMISWDKEPVLQIPVNLPEEYQLFLFVRRESSRGTFVVNVPHQGGAVSVLFEGKFGNGLSQIRGESYASNPTNIRKKLFAEGKTHVIEIASSSQGLLVKWDDESLFEYTGSSDDLSLDRHCPHAFPQLPAIKAANGGRFTIEQAIIQTEGKNTPKPVGLELFSGQ